MRFRSAPHLFDHRVGGDPTGLGPRGLPVCNNCQRKLAFVLQVATQDPQLELANFRCERVFVLTCRSCDANCQGMTHYRPSRSGRSLRLVSMPDAEPLPHSATPSVRPRTIEFIEPDSAMLDGPVHQFGGEPVWLDEPAEPRCRACDQPMSFLLQMDSEPDLGFVFGDHGVLYAFVCGRCAEVATTVQTAR